MNVTHTRPAPADLLTPQECSFLDRLKQHKDAKLMGKLQQLAGRA